MHNTGDTEIFAKMVTFVARVIDDFENVLYLEEDPFPPEIEDSSMKQISKKKDEKEEELENALKLLKISGIPKSLNVKFLDSLLKMSYDTKPYWKTYHQFWLIFQEFATIGTPIRKMMLGRGYLRFFIHVYLGEESPFFTGKKKRKIKRQAHTRSRKTSYSKHKIPPRSDHLSSPWLPYIT